MSEKQFPEAVLTLVRRMLEFDPEERITCEEILQHPWVGANKSGDQRANDAEPTKSMRLTFPVVVSPPRSPARSPGRMAPKVAPGMSPKRLQSRTPTHGTHSRSTTEAGGFSRQQPRYHDQTHGRVVEAMQKMGFAPEVIHESIERRACNIVTATHYLLMRQYEREEQESET